MSDETTAAFLYALGVTVREVDPPPTHQGACTDGVCDVVRVSASRRAVLPAQPRREARGPRISTEHGGRSRGQQAAPLECMTPGLNV